MDILTLRTQKPNVSLSISTREVFEQLFREHYAPLVGYAMKLVRERDQAEDLVQQVFVGMWEKRDELQIDGNPRSYLLRSTHNACLNHLKHLQVREEHASHVKSSVDQSEASDHLEQEEFRVQVQELIRDLPPQCRKIFLMSRLQGKKYQEIADDLQLSVKTVENQMGKALKILREALQTEARTAMRIVKTFFWLIVGVNVLSVVIKGN